MLMRLVLVPITEAAGRMVAGEAVGSVGEEREDTKSSGRYLYACIRTVIRDYLAHGVSGYFCFKQ